MSFIFAGNPTQQNLWNREYQCACNFLHIWAEFPAKVVMRLNCSQTLMDTSKCQLIIIIRDFLLPRTSAHPILQRLCSKFPLLEFFNLWNLASVSFQRLPLFYGMISPLVYITQVPIMRTFRKAIKTWLFLQALEWSQWNRPPLDCFVLLPFCIYILYSYLMLYGWCRVFWLFFVSFVTQSHAILGSLIKLINK